MQSTRHSLFSVDDQRNILRALQTPPAEWNSLNDTNRLELEALGNSTVTNARVAMNHHSARHWEHILSSHITAFYRRSEISRPIIISSEWSLSLQSRPGAHHGQGGRRRLGSSAARRERVPGDVCSLLCSSIARVVGLTITQCVELIIKMILDTEEVSPELDLTASNFPWNSSRSTLRSFEVLQCPYFAACHKVSYGGMQREGANVMERHLATFWIDYRGNLLCTCVGSTSFRSIHLMETEEQEMVRCQCVHTEGLLMFIEALSKLIQAPPTVISKTISAIFEEYSGTSINSYRVSLPRVFEVHNCSAMVVSNVVAGENIVTFVPVRKLRDSGALLCCFCDTTHAGSCSHANECQSHAMNDASIGPEIETEHSASPLLGSSPRSTPSIISHLPLSPANCERSVRIDMQVNRAAIGREPFLISAPQVCHCGFDIIPTSRSVV